MESARRFNEIADGIDRWVRHRSPGSMGKFPAFMELNDGSGLEAEVFIRIEGEDLAAAFRLLANLADKRD